MGRRWRGTCAHAEGWAGFQPSGPDSILLAQVDGAHAHPIDYKNWARQFVPGPVGEPGGSGGGIGGTGLPAGTGDGIPNSLFSGTRPVLPTPPPPPARAIRTSSMLEGNLIRRSSPCILRWRKPRAFRARWFWSRSSAKRERSITCTLSPGLPCSCRQRSMRSASGAIVPYILNSEPIEVETQITVNFYLSGN
jgi:hypothetical protein